MGLMRLCRPRGGGGGGGGGGGRVGQGVQTPTAEKSQIYRVSDPLKITKLPSQHSMLGNHRPATKMLFKWRLACGPMMAGYQCYLEK